MPKRYHSTAAVCPYYRGEDCSASGGGASLFCAGPGDAETIRLFFRSKDLMKAHADPFCRGDWQECPIAQMLQYDEGWA